MMPRLSWMLMSRELKTPKYDAFKTWMAWGRSAMESLREKGVNLEDPPAELNRRVEAAIIARAHTEAMGKPKILLHYEYPIGLFLDQSGGVCFDAFERGLPAAIEIAKLYIPFADGSALLVQTPSELTMQCGMYVELLGANSKFRDLMGVDPGRLAGLAEISLLVKANKIAALSAIEVRQALDREFKVSHFGSGPTVQVNFASERLNGQAAVELLRDFFKSPTDTVSGSLEKLLAQKYRVHPPTT